MGLNKNNRIEKNIVLQSIRGALEEDIGTGDITTNALVPKNLKIVAEVIAKEKNFVICGVEIIKDVFQVLNKKCKVRSYARDGDFIKNKRLICKIIGDAQAILAGERTALNFLSRLSGIATQTAILEKLVKTTKVKILDTRKTTPGLRILEKKAVKNGGGFNHRFGLFDQVLIKDNHIKILKLLSKENKLDKIISIAKEKANNKIIEIEVKNLSQLLIALSAKPDIIMLDNMSLKMMRDAVKLRNKVGKKIKLEASGNISQRNIKMVAKTGVDFLSLGMLTHSVKSIDFSLDIKKIY